MLQGVKRLPIIAGLLLLVAACRPETPEEYCRPHPKGTFGCLYDGDRVIQPGCGFPNGARIGARGLVLGPGCSCTSRDGVLHINCLL
jgi:hypothetical protein